MDATNEEEDLEVSAPKPVDMKARGGRKKELWNTVFGINFEDIFSTL